LALHPGVSRLGERRMTDARLEGVWIFPDRLVSYLVFQPGACELHKEAYILRYAGIEFDVGQVPKFLHGQTIRGDPIHRMIHARTRQRVHPNEGHWMRMRLKLLSQQLACVNGWNWIAEHHPRFKGRSIGRIVEDACR